MLLKYSVQFKFELITKDFNVINSSIRLKVSGIIINIAYIGSDRLIEDYVEKSI